jgi:hypothetical protein
MGKLNLDCDGEVVTCEDFTRMVIQDDRMYALRGTNTL